MHIVNYDKFFETVMQYLNVETNEADTLTIRRSLFCN